MMPKTRGEGQHLVLEGAAYDNFINAVRSKSSQNFYLVELKKFMAYNRIMGSADDRIKHNPIAFKYAR
ncbi:MAG TPA: hypothetical protein VJ729_17005 [Nitrososphaeraceae archaeon]|nr:hypothetical protein [Nitrososphaeraceae archaeon]